MILGVPDGIAGAVFAAGAGGAESVAPVSAAGSICMVKTV